MQAGTWKRPDFVFEDNGRGYLRTDIIRELDKFVFSCIRHYDIVKYAGVLFPEKERIINNYFYEKYLNGTKYIPSNIANEITDVVFEQLEVYVRDELLSGKHIYRSI